MKVQIQELSERQLQIIKRLLTNKEKISSNYLGEVYRVSSRTIRYDLDNIEYYLNQYELKLDRHRLHGLTIQGDHQQKQALLEQMENPNISLTYLIAVEFLLHPTSTIMNLANKFMVSKNKVNQVMPEVEAVLLKANLTLAKRPAVGVSIQGSEHQIRMAIFKINLLASEDLEEYLLKRLPLADQLTIKAIINCYQKAIGTQFSDQGVKELVLALCYQQLRLKGQHYISYPYDEVKQTILCEDLETILRCFKDQGIVLPVEEAIFVLKQIRNTQVIYSSKVVNDDASEMAKEFAALASARLGIDFTNNHNFLNGLRLHLNVAIHRLQTDQVIQNPLTEQVKYKYRFIFETCKKIIMQLEPKYQLNFPDDEIAYLAMHVGACLEVAHQVGYLPKALVVCHSGLATSILLATRLKIMLPEMRILGPIGLSELKPELIDEVDLVISTVAFPLTEKELIVVNPLLEMEDVIRLKKRMLTITNRKQLSHLILDQEEGASPLMMKDLVKAGNIQLQVKVENWRSGIEIAATPLTKQGFVTQQYVRAMIEAVEKFGPYMVLIPKIAFVHAAPKSGVLKEGISILTLKEPILLGDKNGATVSCFIVLAALQKESQLILDLIKILDSEENQERLMTSFEKDEILQLNGED